MTELLHRTEEQLLAGLGDIRAAPADGGTVEMIVVRPGSEQRDELDRCTVSFEGGVHGDAWARGCWLKLDDGRPHPDVQICIMSARVIQLLAGSRDRWALAGDNLFVDLDITRDNLQAGQRLSLGSAVIEITEQAHNGCKKFVQRYGKDAVAFVNSPQGKQMRLRGIYATVIEAGEISVGDVIRKV